MRYALLSDIHANRPALAAVLGDIASLSDVSAVYHLGDLVGYGPWPNEVVRLVRDADVAGVAGNYDSTVATGYKHCGCTYADVAEQELSRLSFDWTVSAVSKDTRRFLNALPFRIDFRPLGGHVAGPTVTLLHGAQTLNTVYTHAGRSDAFLTKMARALGAAPGDVVCFGHTHRPWYRLVDNIHFINAGSVGRPKDGDWRAAYVLLDVTAEATGISVRPEVVRVEYDIGEAVRAIRASALPDEFAAFLETGGNGADVRSRLTTGSKHDHALG
ncbi:MAG: metallophosphoesterase family protein [Gemmatimonadaceae bacterium]